MSAHHSSRLRSRISAAEVASGRPIGACLLVSSVFSARVVYRSFDATPCTAQIASSGRSVGMPAIMSTASTRAIGCPEILACEATSMLPVLPPTKVVVREFASVRRFAVMPVFFSACWRDPFPWRGQRRPPEPRAARQDERR